jgi:propionyl-CoA carboxylase alpha chain/3-methylcrotonyl-CoA carboxylase alpha subunit
VHTGFIEARLENLIDTHQVSAAIMAGTAALVHGRAVEADEAFFNNTTRTSPWAPIPEGLFGFRLGLENGAPVRSFADGQPWDWRVVARPDWTWSMSANGETILADVEFGRRGQPNQVVLDGGESVKFIDDDQDVVVFSRGSAVHVSFRPPLIGVVGQTSGTIVSPMPGKVSTVAVKAGDTVARGQTLMVLEAMKMEHALAAPFDGEVAELSVAAGDQVSEGVALAKVTQAE